MKMSEKIRESLIDLSPYATNREISHHCEVKYKFTPSPQQIYETLGSEKDRLAETFNGRELMDLKRFARKHFGGDLDRLSGALKVVQANGRLA
jgi:hypothetical protein